MTVDPARIVCVSRRFAASAERVFDAWLKPETVSKWLFATETGTRVRVEIDPRVGGRFVIVERRNGEDVEHTGEYLELDRPRRLVFTFSVPKFSAEATRVIIDIAPLGSGCELTLTHEGVLTDYLERTKGGWKKLLEELADQVDAKPGVYGVVTSADTVRFERLLPGPIERVWSYLVESDKRGQWFATGEMPPRVGAEVVFEFQHASLSPHVAPTPEKFKACDGVVIGHHRVTIFEPPHQLGITWGEGQDISEVLFELATEGNQVRFTLTHRRLANRAAMLDVAGGWHTHLAVLTERLNGRTPPAFWTLFGKIEEDYEQRFKPE